MATKAYYPRNEIGPGKVGFSKPRSSIEAPFYGNNVIKVNTLKEAYELAKNAPGTVVTDMPVYRGEEFGLEPDAKVLLFNDGSVPGRYAPARRITGKPGVDTTALMEKKEVVVEKAADETLEADVVVIGAGGAGLAAAISAEQNGAKVIVVEKMPKVGGNTILAGTIEDNLRLGNPDLTQQQMEQALRDACAWDFVSALPQGLQTPVGEGGKGLSEGQAQRIAIARAFVRKAPFLILDEATSALDNTSEKYIQAEIEKMKQTDNKKTKEKERLLKLEKNQTNGMTVTDIR